MALQVTRKLKDMGSWVWMMQVRGSMATFCTVSILSLLRLLLAIMVLVNICGLCLPSVTRYGQNQTGLEA